MIYSYPRERRSPGWRLEVSAQGRRRILKGTRLQSLYQLSYGALLVKHGDSRARERHQLICYQVDEHVRHRAVERFEGEPSHSVTFWDNDAGSKIHLLANPGQDVAHR